MQGWQKLGTTADFPGYASKVIENNMSKGTIALFLQGFDGDITTVLYKDANSPREAEPLGNILGLSTLHELKNIHCTIKGNLKVINEVIELPMRNDFAQQIESLQTEQTALLQSLRGTSLNIKTFLPLYIKYNLNDDYPSYYSHRYFHEEMIGRSDLESLDIENRRNIDKYIRNIYTMEKLARIQENLSLLERLRTSQRE